ncbi:MAG: glycosyltransferase, partial [Agathobacter sp.]|nr:glycosyltransferase [Agathobacter sp.]
MDKKRVLVLSGINLHEGGPLSIYVDLLKEIHALKLDEIYEIYAFVYSRELFKNVECDVKYIEIPNGRKSYAHRFYYEYWYFYKFSKSINIDIWLSLHDMTPNVIAKTRMVYCHNPSPFLKPDKKVFKYSKSVFLMSLLYKYIYRINIKKNDWVIVQQDWIRNEFIRLYGVKNVIVARPTTHEQINIDATTTNGEKKDRKYTFIFASYPRVFKNFDVILAADKILEEKGVDGYEVILTLDGSENAYANDLKKEYTNLRNIKWTGLLDRNVLLNLYGETDCMIFPSKLETWGLPISEY